jgi:hypothetical protein
VSPSAVASLVARAMAVACEIKRESPLYEEKLNLLCTHTTTSHEDVDMIISLKIFTGYRQHNANNQQEKILYFEVPPSSSLLSLSHPILYPSSFPYFSSPFDYHCLSSLDVRSRMMTMLISYIL